MAKNIDGLTPSRFGVTFTTPDTDAAAPIVLGNDVRGAFINCSTVERDLIDGRKLDNNMLILSLIHISEPTRPY